MTNRKDDSKSYFLFGNDVSKNKYKLLKVIKQCTAKNQYRKNSKQIFPENELRGHNPTFNIVVSVSDFYIPAIDLPILLQEICVRILGIYKSLTDT